MADQKQISHNMSSVPQAPKTQNNELVGGIELGLSRGLPLNNILASFFNAGYSKQEIDEAARIAQQNSSQPQTIQFQQQIQRPAVQKQTLTSIQQQVQKTPQQPQQKVSNYDVKMPKKPKGKFLMVLLIILLVLAGAVAISYFFFKEEIEELFLGLINCLIF